MLNYLTSLSRLKKQFILMLLDSILLVLIILVAFSLVFGVLYWPTRDLLWVVFGAPIIAIPIFVYFGLYRTIIRFIDFKALWVIIKAVTIYTLLWGMVGFIVEIEGLFLSIVLINWLVSSLAIGGMRVTGRWAFAEGLNKINKENCSNVLIYGAGSAGRQLTIALTESNEYNPVAFIDDKREIHNKTICGIKVISKDTLGYVIDQNDVTEVLLAIPSLPRLQRNKIINFLEPYPVVVRSLPSVSMLAKGKVRINDLLEIDLRDLLGRDLVNPNQNLLKVSIYNKVVLVTGAGGSIGSELCRQIVFIKPKKIILFDVSEPSLYFIEQELINLNLSDIEVCPVLGSVTNANRIEFICKYYEVQTIYHAAAYKHVPLVEHNVVEGIFNNSIGTLITANAAISSNVETFVLISTDKAVRSSSVMGASKRVAEMILQAHAKQQNNTCFTMVRFGNVLDSSGSVIPLFKKQIQEGGPLTVTHPDVMRYFMTIPEAVQLVIQSGAMALGGEVFVLEMGEPIRIYDLAVKMIRLSGLTLSNKENPDGDIEISYTGLRPGEKLTEELLVDGNYTLTENKLIMRAEDETMSWDKLKPIIDKLREASINGNEEESLKILTQLVPESNLRSIKPKN